MTYTHNPVHLHRDVQGGAPRALVFGVSDGLVSNVALILGVAAATGDASFVRVAGLSGLLAGAISMAAGEYVSVKAQTELIERELDIERRSLVDNPEEEQAELAEIYRTRGLDKLMPRPSLNRFIGTRRPLSMFTRAKNLVSTREGSPIPG